MQAPPYPDNEKQRLAALCALQILDTEPEERFDRFTRIAKAVFDVPMAIISLVDAERQWFKSRQGLDAAETPRDVSFCGHAILSDVVFCIPDALKDPRFADNPLVTGPPSIRFYAGAPLQAADGSHVGTLCILDTEPREFTKAEERVLDDLAQGVANELNQAQLHEKILELAEQRHYTESILNSVTEGIVAIDHHGAVQSFNPAAERMFGYAAEEVVGRSFRLLLTDPHARDLEQFLQRYLAGEETDLSDARREVEGRRSNGSVFPLGLAIGKMDLGGKPMFNGVVRDISERKKLDRMKNEFISTVSHELRTPLTSIMGSLGLIKGGALGEVSQEIQAMLEIAHNSSERLVRLVNDMLNLERIESGQMKIHAVPIDIVALTEMALIEIDGFRRELQVELKLSDQVGTALVLGDADQLNRAMINLLSNAIKFSPTGDSVEVEIVRGEGKLKWAVADRGPGIPAEFREEIFDRFSQADTSDSKQKGGTGLGLSITKAIVELHGGELGFTSAPERGTRFFFELPEYSATGTEAAAPDRQIGQILICEHDQDVANLLALILRNANFGADVAATVEDARTRLASHRYDAMTLDLCLPGGDGISLIHELRAQPATEHLPIVVVSANIDESAERLDGAAMGIVDWIPRPLDLDLVLSGISKAIQHNKSSAVTVLHVEDDPNVTQFVAALLKGKAELITATTVREGRQLLGQRDFDLVLLDLMLPDESGEALLPLLQRSDGTPIPVVIFSGEPASDELANRVSASLLKAETSNARLVNTILSLLPQAAPKDGESGNAGTREH